MRSSAGTIRPALRRPRLALPRLPMLVLPLAKLAALGAVVVTCLWFGLPQGLGGRAGWVLVSGTSMLPRFHTGDLVLVEHQSRYHIGEVVAYRVPKGEVGAGHVVIHRIVGGDGTAGWRLKGDNRTAPDLWYPTNHDVIGAEQLQVSHAWLVLRIFHMPVLLALFAAFGVFFRIALSGSGDAEAGVEEQESR